MRGYSASGKVIDAAGAGMEAVEVPVRVTHPRQLRGTDPSQTDWVGAGTGAWRWPTPAVGAGLPVPASLTHFVTPVPASRNWAGGRAAGGRRRAGGRATRDKFSIAPRFGCFHE